MKFTFLFFFNDTATTEIYTLSLHDALPISAKRPADVRAPGLRHNRGTTGQRRGFHRGLCGGDAERHHRVRAGVSCVPRSEEHTSELQSRQYLVCRLLLEKKKLK